MEFIYGMVIARTFLMIVSFATLKLVYVHEYRNTQFRVQRRKAMHIRLGIAAISAVGSGVILLAMIYHSYKEAMQLSLIQWILCALCVMMMYFMVSMLFNLADLTNYSWLKTIIIFASVLLMSGNSGAELLVFNRVFIINRLFVIELLISVAVVIFFATIYMRKNVKI